MMVEDKGRPLEDIWTELEKASEKDNHFSEGRILNSMYTSPQPVAVKAHNAFLEANLGNPGLYPGTMDLERKVIESLAKLLGSIHPSKIDGYITSGGTESNITALWMAKQMSKGRDVIFSENAHFSMLKACKLLSMNPITVPLDSNSNYCMDIEAVKGRVTKDTAAIVAVAGSTELGMVDDIKALADIPGNHMLYVDAAFGGFVLPYLRKKVHYNFAMERVDAIGIDPHKMGLSIIPSGAILYRDEMFEHMERFDSPYLTKNKHQGILGTRCSSAVASTYAIMEFMGNQGYSKLVQECMDNTNYLVRRMDELGFKPVVEPLMNIACFQIPNLPAVVQYLKERNWYVSESRNPPALRIVVMPHVTKEVIDNFILDFNDVNKSVLIDQK